MKRRGYSQQVSDFLKSIYVTLLCHAKCTADFQEYYQPFHVKLTITHVAHFSAGQVYNPFSSSQKSASLQSASLQVCSLQVCHRRCKSVSGPIFGLCLEHLSILFRIIGLTRSQLDHVDASRGQPRCYPSHFHSLSSTMDYLSIETFQQRCFLYMWSHQCTITCTR